MKSHSYKQSDVLGQCSVCQQDFKADQHWFPGAVYDSETLSEVISAKGTNSHFNRAMIERGAAYILEGLGVDITDHNFSTTPQRVADVYEELFTPPETNWAVFDEDYTDIVIVRDHLFHTMCPHHLLPVTIRAAVAYFPAGKVIGASKLMRLIDEVNRKPLTQEKLTDLICQSIKKHTSDTSLGEAVLLEGLHGCFSIRGRKSHAGMVTMKFEGRFKDEPEWQRRFLEQARVR